MKAKIKPGVACGMVQAPPSKSMAHRYLIAAALADGKSVIRGIEFSQDILATIDCLRALGVDLYREGDQVVIWGGGELTPLQPLYCRESGSTLRFMLPLCLLSGIDAVLQGSDRLMERPLSVYEQLSVEKGFTLERAPGYVRASGFLKSGEYQVDGSVSSQFITGLIFALLKLPGDSSIQLNGKVESRSYLDLTLSALNEFGFSVQWEGENAISVPGGTAGIPRNLAVEGDYSNAAFFDALNLLGGSVQVAGLKADSLQGDRAYRAYFEALSKGPATLSLADCPDLGPILFAVAAALQGGTFTDTARLKIKESDRGAAMAEELSKCGVKLVQKENEIIVPGGCLKAPGEEIEGHNDHRIVMAMAVLLSKVGGRISGIEAVSKSMPDFFNKFSSLGIEVLYNEAE